MLKTTPSANDIRAQFLAFFQEKNHYIVPSAPLVLKNDPTLLFTNAGMNQFKDYFLNYKEPNYVRVANTQKCLRVSGKHNDLEDVGMDTYHHTMFEMLGNWSFGDYFKKDAIAFAWELLTEKFQIPKDRLYVTVFEGDEGDGLPEDSEAYSFWKEWISEDRILKGNKKDNFWEMGDTGPCGPCSEIHVDIRDNEQRNKLNGKELVNRDHPLVVELWNLVFMQFNRKADGSLEKLPNQHVDTGMGFERLCMVLQGKKSNYDTDVFQPIIKKIVEITSKSYEGGMDQSDIAMRVIADHVRAIAFAIADGQLPSNTGAGYVIRRILRRAVRYGYSFLDLSSPFVHDLVSVLVNLMGEAFPELKNQKKLIENVIREEEKSFLQTLESGLKRIKTLQGNITGKQAFELYDTYGFPLDLTQLIVKEKGFTVDEVGFANEMQKQKDRSRKDAKIETGDWVVLTEGLSKFVGYDQLTSETDILRYRTVNQKGKDIYQIVLAETPFYAESGGQVGDKGSLEIDGENIKVFDTKKENELIIHFVNQIPENPRATVKASVNEKLRHATENNHTATHLLHAALREVLGTHVEQKGSLVAPDKLRFDFSHFSKMSEEELQRVEQLVNEKIQQNISKQEQSMRFDEAMEKGAMALFGEKYGDQVRVITFDENYSTELCGGCHVNSTAQICLFKILNESASAAGIRRIEAVSGQAAINYYKEKENFTFEVAKLVKNDKNPLKALQKLINENARLEDQLANYILQQSSLVKQHLIDSIQQHEGMQFIGEVIELPDADALKNIAFELKNEIDNLVLILGANVNGKALLTVMIAENIVKKKNLKANLIIIELAKQIKGGGGGQAFYATAGGSDVDGLQTAVEMGRSLLIG